MSEVSRLISVSSSNGRNGYEKLFMNLYSIVKLYYLFYEEKLLMNNMMMMMKEPVLNLQLVVMHLSKKY
jgi:hypothetical protein